MIFKLIKIALTISPYLPYAKRIINILFKLKKLSKMEEKIKKASEIIDEMIDFGKLASGIKNPILKGVVASLDLVDGTLIRVGLTEGISKVPDSKKWIIEGYLDALIAGRWDYVVDNTSIVVNTFVDIPGATEQEELDLFHSILVVMFALIKKKLEK